jgi:hypothetical protein
MQGRRLVMVFTFAVCVPACVFWFDRSDYSRDAGDATSPAAHPASDEADAHVDGTMVSAESGALSIRYRSEVIADSPIAYFRFEGEQSAGCTNEVSPSPISCIYPADGVTRGVPGPVGRALHFDGTSQVALAGGLDFPNDTPFTIEFLMTLEVAGSPPVLAQMQPTPRTGTWMWVTDPSFAPCTGCLRTETWVNNEHYLYTMTAEALPTTQILHIALSHTDRDYLYVNGRVASGSIVTPGLRRQPTGVPMMLGGYPGLVDEFAVYDHALTPERFVAHIAAR